MKSELYYRLKQTDFDGTTSYSEIIRVQGQPEEPLSVFPNPLHAGDNIRVKLKEGYMQEGFYLITLYDAMGRTINAQRIGAETGVLTITPAEVLKSGMYTLKITLPETGKTVTRRISVVD